MLKYHHNYIMADDNWTLVLKMNSLLEINALNCNLNRKFDEIKEIKFITAVTTSNKILPTHKQCNH